jgi:Intracellular proteinase inhibitor
VNPLHKRRKIIATIAALLAILLPTVYLTQNIMNSSMIAGSTVYSSISNGLQLSLTLDAKTTTYAQGQNINITLRLTNVSHQTLNLSFDNPNSYFSLEVRDSNNSLVFSASDNGQPVGNETLAPQRSVKDTFYWDTGYRNNHLPVGVYQIVGYLVTKTNGDCGFQTTPLNITINQASPTPNNTNNQQHPSQH